MATLQLSSVIGLMNICKMRDDSDNNSYEDDRYSWDKDKGTGECPNYGDHICNTCEGNARESEDKETQSVEEKTKP